MSQCGFCNGDGSCGLHRFLHVGAGSDYPPLRGFGDYFDPALDRQREGIWVYPEVGALAGEHMVISEVGGGRVNVEWGMVPRLVAAISRVAQRPCPHGVSGVRCDDCYALGLLGIAHPSPSPIGKDKP